MKPVSCYLRKLFLLTTFSRSWLLLFFLFQQTNFVGIFFQIDDHLLRFLINRTIRFVVNDALAIGLIYALFSDRKYVVFAIAVQVFGFFFLLLPYFLLKFNWPSYNGPLINFLHRIILNPTLILLLIPAFYYQKQMNKS